MPKLDPNIMKQDAPIMAFQRPGPRAGRPGFPRKPNSDLANNATLTNTNIKRTDLNNLTIASANRVDTKLANANLINIQHLFDDSHRNAANEHQVAVGVRGGARALSRHRREMKEGGKGKGDSKAKGKGKGFGPSAFRPEGGYKGKGKGFGPSAFRPEGGYKGRARVRVLAHPPFGPRENTRAMVKAAKGGRGFIKSHNFFLL